MAPDIHETILGISQSLLKHGFEQKIVAESLGKVGTTLGVDRVYIFENSTSPRGEALCSQRYEWTSMSTKAEIDNPELQNVLYKEIAPTWVAPLSSGKIVKGTPRTFPSPCKEVLEAQRIRSLLVCPITVQGEWWGFVGFDDCHTERDWPIKETNALHMLSNALAGALRHASTFKNLEDVQGQLRSIINRYSATPKS